LAMPQKSEASESGAEAPVTKPDDVA